MLVIGRACARVCAREGERGRRRGREGASERASELVRVCVRVRGQAIFIHVAGSGGGIRGPAGGPLQVPCKAMALICARAGLVGMGNVFETRSAANISQLGIEAVTLLLGIDHAASWDRRGHAASWDRRGHAASWGRRGHAASWGRRGHAACIIDDAALEKLRDAGRLPTVDERTQERFSVPVIKQLERGLPVARY